MRRVALLLAGGLAACHPVEGPSGVHASVDVDGSFAPNEVFDHLTVRASDGTRSATVCFTTAEGDARAFEPTGTGADPCADVATYAWAAAPTARAWALAEAPRTANFGFDDGATVTVTATAALGGRVVGTAAATGRAVPGYASVALHVARSGDPSCPLALGETLGPTATDLDLSLCGDPPVACVPTLVGRDEPAHTAAVTCDGSRLFVDDAPGDGCADGPTANVVLRTRSAPQVGCPYIELTGFFHGCAEGDPRVVASCTPTAECHVPPTSVVFASELDTHAVDLGCAPPLAFPVTMLLPVGDMRARARSVLIVQAPHDDPADCIFELDHVRYASDVGCKAQP